ncbi:adenosylcobinamide-GDP ribazoletransferase [Frankia sp. AgPm24]|uniref:adenosylcobinamide-GDP ribazoletransferase n=1 Tax=Frankia sp. AgPm24 TaxID=631128 RepID=UPI002010A257|nr:adenosylcobinamide-GDP ribazoletransferase [Frankia sp. AgPm24]MCK9925217.1 adenosylcobinamide-GDP ribazoletransferase [Frankia sp. AgPm24]
MTVALRTAFSLLTVAPVRGPGRLDRRVAGRAMALAPLVGLVLGVVAALVVFGLRVSTGMPGTRTQTLLPAVAGIAVLALATRGLHLDGLADLADGLGARHAGGRERALAVMREPTIGAFGVVAVLFVVLLQVTALGAAITVHRGTVSMLVAVMTGRLAVTLACASSAPAAHPNGLGAFVAGSVRARDALVAFVGVCAVAALAGRFDYDGGDLERAARAVIAVCVGAAVSVALRYYFVRRLGGLTGDVLGGLVELTTVVTLLFMAMTYPDWLLHLVGSDAGSSGPPGWPGRPR